MPTFFTRCLPLVYCWLKCIMDSKPKQTPLNTPPVRPFVIPASFLLRPCTSVLKAGGEVLVQFNKTMYVPLTNESTLSTPFSSIDHPPNRRLFNNRTMVHNESRQGYSKTKQGQIILQSLEIICVTLAHQQKQSKQKGHVCRSRF